MNRRYLLSMDSVPCGKLVQCGQQVVDFALFPVETIQS